jgi:hypothetical protein
MEKDKKYYLTDIESGQLYEVTKEQYESYYRMLKQVFKPSDRVLKSHLILHGTGGGFIDKSLKELEKMFYNPQNYRIVKWDDK